MASHVTKDFLTLPKAFWHDLRLPELAIGFPDMTKGFWQIQRLPIVTKSSKGFQTKPKAHWHDQKFPGMTKSFQTWPLASRGKKRLADVANSIMTKPFVGYHVFWPTNRIVSACLTSTQSTVWPVHTLTHFVLLTRQKLLSHMRFLFNHVYTWHSYHRTKFYISNHK